MINQRSMHFYAAALLGFPVLAPASVLASLPIAHKSHTRGELVRIQTLETIDRNSATELARSYSPELSAEYAISLFRIVYWTRYRGAMVQVSGLIGRPEGVARPKGVVAYFHGTNVARDLAPSQPDRIDGNDEAALFGGSGYLVILPDYIGMGISHERHPYLLTMPQVDASIDMLRAVKAAAPQLGIAWAPHLFMFGFSQGGQVVAGVHRELERHPLGGYQLMASGGIAGPYDLRGTARSAVLANDCQFCTGYLAWAAISYAAEAGKPLDSLLLQDATRTMPVLFDGSHRVDQIIPHLPRSAAALLRPEIAGAFKANRRNWFNVMLDRNETWRWIPQAPFRAYFGTADTDVSPISSLTFYRFASKRGGKVSLHALGPVDHLKSAQLAYPQILAWFESLVPMH